MPVSLPARGELLHSPKTVGVSLLITHYSLLITHYLGRGGLLHCPPGRGRLLHCPPGAGQTSSLPARGGADFFTARQGRGGLLHCPPKRGKLLHCPPGAGRTSSQPKDSGRLITHYSLLITHYSLLGAGTSLFTARRGRRLSSSTLLNLMYRTSVRRYAFTVPVPLTADVFVFLRPTGVGCLSPPCGRPLIINVARYVLVL